MLLVRNSGISKNIPNFGFVRLDKAFHFEESLLFSRLKILLLISFCICPKKIKPIFSSFQPEDKKKFPYGGMNSKKGKYLYYFLYFLCKSKIEYFYFFFYSFLSNSTAIILMWLHFCSYWPAFWYRVKSNLVKSSVHMIFAFCFFPVLRFVMQLCHVQLLDKSVRLKCLLTNRTVF